MKLPHDSRPDLVTTTESDPRRMVLKSLLLEIDGPKARVVATNGRAILLLPVEVSETDTAGLVPKEAIELAAEPKRRMKTVGDDEDGFEEVVGPIEVACLENTIRVDGSLSVARPDLKFPKYQSVFDEIAGEPIVAIGLNAEFLVALQRGMGAPAIKLEIFGPNKAMRVTPAPNQRCAAREATGLLMPVRLSSESP